MRYKFCIEAVFFFLVAILSSCNRETNRISGKTEILKWQNGKKAAISLTYDDGSINQFRVALPMMDSLDFPATFFIITGEIPGSEFQPKFIGRSMDTIIKETSAIQTNEDNLIERASLAAYAPYEGLRDYHTRAGELYESGKVKEACELIDTAFSELRSGKLMKIETSGHTGNTTNRITWEEIRQIAANGHEFASHTITHPRLAVLDEANFNYELEKSKQELMDQLGKQYTFSAECPYGTENERVMSYAYKVYPALRNRMPEPFLEELDRGSKKSPENSQKEYVQWQRGPLTDTPLDLMKSWVEISLDHNNIWLVLVFHGVEGIGWEPRTREEFLTYFNYLKEREDRLWIATFGDVIRYMRERINSQINISNEKDQISIKLVNDLDPDYYSLPVTVKTYIPEDWEQVNGTLDNEEIILDEGHDATGRYVIYQAIPNGGNIVIAKD